MVAKLAFKSLSDNREGAPLIMAHEIFDIFQQKGARLFDFNNPGYIEKQSSLSWVVKAMSVTERFMFSDSSYRERLAWKTTRQDVMIRYIFCFNLSYIASGFVTEICRVCLGGKLIPFRSKNAFATKLLKRNAETAYTGKKINKGKIGSIHAVTSSSSQI